MMEIILRAEKKDLSGYDLTHREIEITKLVPKDFQTKKSLKPYTLEKVL